MPQPALLAVLGTRADLFEAAPLLRLLTREHRQHRLPFKLEVVSSGQESTELEQAWIHCGLRPDKELDSKEHRQADSRLSAELMLRIEAGVRQSKIGAVLVVGASATAWAAAVAAWLKQVPVIHLGAGQFTAPGRRPRPEWLHRRQLADIASLQLCPDALCAREALERLATIDEDRGDGLWQWPAPEVHTVGYGADVLLAEALAHEAPPDPTLAALRPGAPRVTVFLHRREHHAENLRPVVDALGRLAETRPEADFLVIDSLQSFICDAWHATLPRLDNLHCVPPLPHPAFVRALADSRLVLTDSAGTAREARMLGRPVAMPGWGGTTITLLEADAAGRPPVEILPLEAGAIEQAGRTALEAPAPPPPPEALEAPPAGPRALETIIDWWKRHEAILPRG